MKDYLTVYNKKNRKKIRNYMKGRRIEYKKVDPLYDYRSKLMTQYGLTIEEFDEILEEQGGVCAICETDEWGGRAGKRPMIDHCHDSNIIRGLLCFNCNTMLGLAGDSAEILQRAATYLKDVSQLRAITVDHRKIIHRMNGTSSITPVMAKTRKRSEVIDL